MRRLLLSALAVAALASPALAQDVVAIVVPNHPGSSGGHAHEHDTAGVGDAG